MIDFWAHWDAVQQQSAREEAMRQRFAGQPFIPRTLADEEAFDAGRAWNALDTEGGLHLIGQRPYESSCAPFEK